VARPTVSAGYARALMDLAVVKGASREALAERCEIDLEELRDQDNRIPLEKFIAMMRAAKELCNDPALALHFGEAFNIAELSIVGLIGLSCETFGDAFMQLNRYERLVADIEGAAGGNRLVLVREDGELWLVDTRRNPNETPEITESSFARMISSSPRVGEQRFVKAVHVTHPAPAYREEYDRIFSMPVVFESDRNALLMTNDSWMALRMPHPSRYAFGIFSERAEALLEELEAAKSLRGRIEALLVPILHTGEASIDMVAGKLALSRQTIFRKLKAEGTTFQELLDELRHKMALNYLSGKKVSVHQTAYLVGFSDPASFSRAFKRWTGSSPRAAK
jgi:AraC-like DNA-binding protein